MATMKPIYLERAMFVIGNRNDGKSTQLRSIFRDRRFGTKGVIPKGRKLKTTFRLSNERRLYLRLASPHELKEDLKEFFAKIEDALGSGRWSIISPLQPDAANKMPGLVETIQEFQRHFKPERTRVVFLFPTQPRKVSEFKYADLLEQLSHIENVECCMIDARNRIGNGLFLADFVDYS